MGSFGTMSVEPGVKPATPASPSRPNRLKSLALTTASVSTQISRPTVLAVLPDTIERCSSQRAAKDRTPPPFW